jgi:hypothetical protein
LRISAFIGCAVALNIKYQTGSTWVFIGIDNSNFAAIIAYFKAEVLGARRFFIDISNSRAGE